MKKYFFIVFTIFCLLNVACEKGEVGPKGDKGDTGLTGSKGDKGDTGATGQTGADGADGTNGTDGKDGANGTDGANGETGAQGPKGDTGAPGQNGQNGAQGEKGDTGSTGAQGPKGDTGEKGDKGDPGATGAYTYTYLSYSFANATMQEQTYDNSPVMRIEAVLQIKPANYASLAEKGLVLVYLRDPGNTEGIWNLQSLEGLQYPYNVSANDQGVDLLSFNGYAAKTYVKMVSSCSGDNKTRLINIIKTKKIDVKVVIIPQISVTAAKAEGVDLRNFRAVANHFHVN